MAAATFQHRSFKVGDGKDIDLNGQNIVNSGGASFFANTSRGQYTGDSSVNRAIPHGLGKVPKIVIFSVNSYGGIGKILPENLTTYMDGVSIGGLAVTAMDSTNFYVGNATNYIISLNTVGAIYDWMAIS